MSYLPHLIAAPMLTLPVRTVLPSASAFSRKTSAVGLFLRHLSFALQTCVAFEEYKSILSSSKALSPLIASPGGVKALALCKTDLFHRWQQAPRLQWSDFCKTSLCDSFNLCLAEVQACWVRQVRPEERGARLKRGPFVVVLLSQSRTSPPPPSTVSHLSHASCDGWAASFHLTFSLEWVILWYFTSKLPMIAQFNMTNMCRTKIQAEQSWQKSETDVVHQLRNSCIRWDEGAMLSWFLPRREAEYCCRDFPFIFNEDNAGFACALWLW